jgi:hypothetical protein
MPRLHLFEFEDQSWFPAILRDYMTDYLQHVANQFNLLEPIIPLLEKGLAQSKGNRIIDLASGGGGAWLSILPNLKKSFPDVQVKLTDYYPNVRAFQETVFRGGDDHFSYAEQPIDARAVPPDLTGFRTQFLSFHHFRPHDAQRILQNAVDEGQVIGIFEAQERSIASFLQFFFSPIFVLLLTPFIKPFSLGRLIFTYLIPVLPLLIWFDGLVSVLRTYKPEEMKAMTQQVKGGESYNWEIGVKANGPSRLPYLLGYPKES